MHKIFWIITIIGAISLIANAITGFGWNNALEKIKSKDRIIETVNAENSSLILSKNDLIGDIEFMSSIIEQYKDSFIFDTLYDTLTHTAIVESTVVKTRDSVILRYIETTKPTWGTIKFNDSSNFFTNVYARVDFPYGKRTIGYENKYEIPSSFWYTTLAGLSDFKYPTVGLQIGYKRYSIGCLMNKEQQTFLLGYKNGLF